MLNVLLVLTAQAGLWSRLKRGRWDLPPDQVPSTWTGMNQIRAMCPSWEQWPAHARSPQSSVSGSPDGNPNRREGQACRILSCLVCLWSREPCARPCSVYTHRVHGGKRSDNVTDARERKEGKEKGREQKEGRKEGKKERKGKKE